MSPWAFCSEEQESFFSASVVFGGHPARLRPNSTCLFAQDLFWGGVTGISRSRNQSAYALRVPNVFWQASREVLAARRGLAVRKVTQLALRDLKFCCATIQTNE